MIWIQLLIGVLFVLVGVACVVLTLLSLPGGWIMILIAAVIEIVETLYLPDGSNATFALWTFAAVLGIALVGEILEFMAGAAGAKRGGASKRGIWGALIGGIVGAIAGTPLIPIPVVGSILGAAIGAAIGAIVGEMSITGLSVGSFRKSLKPATGAAAGRVAGTIAKLACTVMIWVVLSVAVFWP